MHDPQSPRRSPRCKKCLQPRKGHPRTGCPNWDRTDSGPGAEEQRASDLTRTQSHRVDADSRLAQRRRRTSAQPTPPQPTHHTGTTEPIQGPVHTLVLDNEKDSLTRKVERWLKSVPSDPGELEPSSPRVKYEEMEDTITGHSRQPKPLSRTMSMEERLGFLERLKQNTKHTAQVFIMNREDAEAALVEAQRQGFHGGVHIPAPNGDAVLVLGMVREAVDALLETVRAERGSPMKNCVAGAVVGAAAMFAGLAYT